MKFQLLKAPKRIIGQEGQVMGMECIKTALDLPDESGRRRHACDEPSTLCMPRKDIVL